MKVWIYDWPGEFAFESKNPDYFISIGKIDPITGRDLFFDCPENNLNGQNNFPVTFFLPHSGQGDFLLKSARFIVGVDDQKKGNSRYKVKLEDPQNRVNERYRASAAACANVLRPIRDLYAQTRGEYQFIERLSDLISALDGFANKKRFRLFNWKAQ